MESFELPLQMDEFREAYERYENKTWIFKPSCGSLGKGIQIVNCNISVYKELQLYTPPLPCLS